MKKIALFCIFSLLSSTGFSAAGQRDTRGKRNTFEKERKVTKRENPAEQARMNPPANDPVVVEKKSSPCPIAKIKTQLNSYCATVVCSSSSALISAIRLGGTNLDTIDGDCQAQVWQEISSKLETTFNTFKSECDGMNSEYASAIELWKKKYDEMAIAHKKMKKQRNIVGGVGAATTVGGTIGGFLFGKKQNAPEKEEK